MRLLQNTVSRGFCSSPILFYRIPVDWKNRIAMMMGAT